MSEADPKFRAERAATTATEVVPPPELEIAAPESPPKKRRWRLILMLSVPLLIALVGGYFWLTSGRYVSTDNAYVQQDMTSVAAEITGTISEVDVRENQFVHRGDVLFKIDPRPFRIALANANAQIAAAQVQVHQLTTHSAGTQADIQAAEANLRYQESNFARYNTLMQQGFTTRTQFESVQHDLQEARDRLANSRSTQQQAQAALASGGTDNQPAIQAAMVARDQALLNLSRTVIRAPEEGFVSQTSRLQVGNVTAQGLPVVTIVRRQTAYIEANYKETDLANMTVGQPAEITFDAYPGVTMHGHVESIGAGTGSQFSLLPPQNATGNWVKVTQRVPVRVAIDGTPSRPLIAGLSVDVSVDTAQHPTQPVAPRPTPAQPSAPLRVQAPQR